MASGQLVHFTGDDAMTKVVTPSRKPITSAQIGKLYDHLTPRLLKSGVKCDAFQRFLGNKKNARALGEKLVELVRSQVSAFGVLVPLESFELTISIPHDLEKWFGGGFWKRGAGVDECFQKNIYAHAKPVAVGTKFKLWMYELERDATDDMIELALPENHFFDEGDVCVILAQMLARGAKERGDDKMEDDEASNLFYTRSSVVRVFWFPDLSTWVFHSAARGSRTWNPGDRVFSPAN